MEWFTETPWPPIFICLAAAGLSFLAWGNGRRRAMLAVAIAFIVACPLLYAFERHHVTAPERVEQRLHELVKAVEADDAQRTLSFFAEENRGDRLLVEKGMGQFRIVGGIRVTDVQVRFNERKTAILSHFRANGQVAAKKASQQGRFATRWELTWQKKGDAWRITKIKRLDPMGDEEIDVLARE